MPETRWLVLTYSKQGSLAWAVGNFRKAVDELGKDNPDHPVTRVPTSSTYHFHLAKAYFQQGDKLRATGQLQLAMKYSPAPTEKSQIQELLWKAQ